MIEFIGILIIICCISYFIFKRGVREFGRGYEFGRLDTAYKY